MRINDDKIKEIENLLNRAYKVKDISSKFKISRTTVSCIGNIPKEKIVKSKHLEIWNMYHNMLTISNISKLVGVSRNIIYNVKLGKYSISNSNQSKPIFIYAKHCQFCGKIFGTKCCSTKFCCQKCGSLFNSDIFRTNMIRNNPMNDKTVRDKVSASLREGYKTGRIKKKFGKEHPRWKGNRTFSNHCRTRLYNDWIFLVLKRDNFKCTKCKTHKKLQVHHIRTLREIVNYILQKNNIDEIELLQDSYKYEELTQQVVIEHKLSDGLTLCHNCHYEIDDFYRRKCCEN